MPDPEVIHIEAYSIDDAAEEILHLLKDTRKSNVMYVHGWDGLGASATLKAVAKRLKSSAAGMFDKVIHVDCSVWKSRRALQKVVAEELELPLSVMAIFEQHDEDDDFNGVDAGSRGEIPEVTRKIFKNLSAHTFVVIFHNGSKSYIDLNDCGIPVYPYLPNRVLWTEVGRFLPRAGEFPLEDIKKFGNACLLATFKKGVDESRLWDILHEEAKEVSEYTGMPECIDHRIVEECILYMWQLRAMEDIHWEIHASNYWVCDGIIQGDRSAWEIGDALQSYVHFGCDWFYMDRAIPFSTTHLQRDMPREPPICQSYSSRITSLPPEATSFFIDNSKLRVLPAGLFQHPDNSKLRVLHLSFCTFSFASPPFLCCSNLRFLLLQHCKDDTNNAEAKYQSHGESASWKACFVKLWVLDLSYTDLYWLLSEEMISVMASLRELNVKGLKHWHIADLRASGTSLVKLRVTSSGPVPAEVDDTKNHSTFPNLSSANNLKTVILDGCVELEQISTDVLPPSIESISFLNTERLFGKSKISSISFRGCSKLKSILLRGCLGSLQELDLSGTAVKTLDLRELEAPLLRRLVLLGCEKLYVILWPPKDKMRKTLEVLRIDNRPTSSCQVYCEEKTEEVSAAATGSSSILVAAATKSGKISRAASVSVSISGKISRAARFLRSLEAVKNYYIRSFGYVYMEIDSCHVSRVAVGSSKVTQEIRSLRPISRSQEPAANQYLNVRDALLQGHLQAGVISWMWDIPRSPTPRATDWYVHMQDQQEMESGLLQQQQTSIEGTSTNVASPPAFICHNARMLHVHDSLSITSIDSFSQGSTWHDQLEWCRVERCTKLHSVFVTPRSDDWSIFLWLQTFWASHLPAVHYIWNWSAIYQPGYRSFEDLVFLHLDYCPRLIYVLPMSKYMATLPCLETLEIVCCGDLREVFPLDPKHPGQQKTIQFRKLKRIHLHELPTLQHICGSRMSTPNLETVKIRGCWSLKCLPAIHLQDRQGELLQTVKVDCEREWWDRLEWDGEEASHLVYEASYSVYYKNAQLPRGTLLR